MFTSLPNKYTLGAWLLPLTLLLASCGSKDDDKPEPKPQYVVQVKMTSVDAEGLGAGGEVYIKRLGDFDKLLLGSSLPANGLKETGLVTNLKTGESVSVGLGFDKATTGSGIVPRVTSKLRGEIWVNGQIKAVVELDRNTPSGNPDYPTKGVRYTMGE